MPQGLPKVQTGRVDNPRFRQVEYSTPGSDRYECISMPPGLPQVQTGRVVPMPPGLPQVQTGMSAHPHLLDNPRFRQVEWYPCLLDYLRLRQV